MEPGEFGSGDELDAAPSQEEDEKKATEEQPKVFRCGCGKAYMSYSALYSHNKQKHAGEPGNLPTGRRRGRPPKNGEPVRSRPKPSEPKASSDPDQEDDSYFQRRGLLGGPADPKVHINSESPLYSSVDLVLQHADSHSEETATCTEAFAAYMVAMAQRLSPEGLKQVTEFVEQLRTCVNQKEGEDYCDVNNPQSLPEQANYFITEYLENNPTLLDRDSAISLMLHFCKWLFIRRYSNLKLSLCDKE